jgi:hypothetical protein
MYNTRANAPSRGSYIYMGYDIDMMMIIYSEFPVLGKMFSCVRCCYRMGETPAGWVRLRQPSS